MKKLTIVGYLTSKVPHARRPSPK